MALERPHPQRLVNAAAAAVKELSSPTALLIHLPLDAAAEQGAGAVLVTVAIGAAATGKRRRVSHGWSQA